LIKFFNSCIELEKTVSGIYTNLANIVDCDQELRKLWLNMAEEEYQHATQIELASRLPKGTFIGIKITQETIDDLLDKALLVHKRTQSPGLSVTDSLRLSIKLETDFQAIHVASAAEFSSPSLSKLFLSLAKGDKVHTEALEAFKKRLTHI